MKLIHEATRTTILLQDCESSRILVRVEATVRGWLDVRSRWLILESECHVLVDETLQHDYEVVGAEAPVNQEALRLLSPGAKRVALRTAANTWCVEQTGHFFVAVSKWIAGRQTSGKLPMPPIGRGAEA